MNLGMVMKGLVVKSELVVFSIILTCLAIEIFFRLSPGIFPIAVRNRMATAGLEDAKNQMVERLPESPYMKFRANTVIRTPSYRGSNQQFVYEWLTDEEGFKNTSWVASLQNVPVVALGDSLTEGMGVATEDTWPSILSEKGYPTYNLGVQGYAPSQMEGAFQRFGAKKKPKYVIIGYCGRTFKREKTFLEPFDPATFKAIGGIHAVVAADEIREQTKFVTVALIRTMRDIFLFQDILGFQKDSPILDQDSILYRYRNEIKKLLSPNNKEDDLLIQEIESNSSSWQRTLQSFIHIKEMADRLGAKTIILYFPRREEVYLKAATGKELLPGTVCKLESKVLEFFAAKTGIIYQDLTAPFEKYVFQLLREESSLHLYPYLEIDSHPSRAGYEIAADEVMTILTRLEKTTNGSY